PREPMTRREKIFSEARKTGPGTAAFETGARNEPAVGGGQTPPPPGCGPRKRGAGGAGGARPGRGGGAPGAGWEAAPPAAGFVADTQGGPTMTRIFRGAWLGALLALGPWLPARAGDDEARALQALDKLKGVATRDAKQKGNPVVAVNLAARDLKDGDLRALAA